MVGSRHRIYLAYGSNLNVKQMSYRCPGAVPIGTGALEGWRLAFRGRRFGAVLTIEPCDGKSVPFVAWEITKEDEASLDRYEGFPDLYMKVPLSVTVTDLDDGRTHGVDAFAYVLVDGYPHGVPTKGYYDTCIAGYEAFSLDTTAIDEALSM